MSGNDNLVVFQTSENKLPTVARSTRLPGSFATLYQQLLTQGLREFPPIEGYETTHVMLVERAVHFFCAQKAAEDLPVIGDIKAHRTNISGFLRTCEALLKEARSISAEATFKHNFIRQVVEVIDRCLASSEQKTLVIRELRKLASQ
jgi:hypothetical protein